VKTERNLYMGSRPDRSNKLGIGAHMRKKVIGLHDYLIIIQIRFDPNKDPNKVRKLGTLR
jgi:hypothetical protein